MILSSPLLSIITPCWNAEATISDTLEGISRVAKLLFNQDFTIQVIFVDGGSTDNTLDQLSEFCKYHKYTQIICSSKDGPYPAMNKGILEAKGTYTHILNSDDCIWDAKLYVEELCAVDKLNCDILLSPILYFSRPGYKINLTWKLDPVVDLIEWKSMLQKGLHYPHPGFIAKTNLYQDFLFDERYKLSADYKLMHQILIRTPDIHSLYISKHVLVGMGQGGLTGQWQNIIRGTREIRMINHELNIKTYVLLRYASKLFKRLLIPQ